MLDKFCRPGDTNSGSKTGIVMQDRALAALPRRYEVVADTLRRNIDAGRLPEGTVLLEGPLAQIFRLSRAPVQRALQELEGEGLVARFEGRGYLVVGSSVARQPRRLDLASLDLDLPIEADDGFRDRQTWRQIYETVEGDITRCLVFGRYRIIETELAEHFRVSRTIVRDVLGRLQDRRLVNKGANSHWIAGPITARTIKDQFEIRRILEPPALISAAGFLPAHRLEAVLAELRGAESRAAARHPEATADLSTHVSREIVLATPNEALRELVARNLRMVTLSQQVLQGLGLPQDLAALAEQRMTVELLVHGAHEAAASMLSTHLDAAKHRTIAQMKIVAVIPPPTGLASYLRRAETDAD